MRRAAFAALRSSLFSLSLSLSLSDDGALSDGAPPARTPARQHARYSPLFPRAFLSLARHLAPLFPPHRVIPLPLRRPRCSYSAGLSIYYILFGTQRRMHSPEAATRWRSANYGLSDGGRAPYGGAASSDTSGVGSDGSAPRGRDSRLPGTSSSLSEVGPNNSLSAVEAEFQHQQVRAEMIIMYRYITFVRIIYRL